MQSKRRQETENRSPIVAWLTSRRKKTSTDNNKRPPIPWGAGPGLTARQQKKEQQRRKPMHTMHHLQVVCESTPRAVLPPPPSHLQSTPPLPEQALLLDALRDAIHRNAELQAAASGQEMNQNQSLPPIAAVPSANTTTTPPRHNQKQPYVTFAPDKSPTFMTSRHRALHCEMDDPSKRLPYVWGRSLTRKTPMEWIKAKFTACFNINTGHMYFDTDDANYVVPSQAGGPAVGNTQAGHDASTVVVAPSSDNKADGNNTTTSSNNADVEAVPVVGKEEEERREPTPLPKLTIHMSPLRTSVAQLPLDEQSISMLRMSLLLGGAGGGIVPGNDTGNVDDTNTGDEASPPKFADLLGLGEEAAAARAPSFAFQPQQKQYAAMSTASSPGKAAAVKPSTSSGSSSRRKPLKQTTVSLSQLLAVASGDAARRTPTSNTGYRAMATSKIDITERLSDMKGFTSAPNSPTARRMRRQQKNGSTAAAPLPPEQHARAAARVPPAVPASAPATPLEKLLKPAVVPRMNKAAQARAAAVRERLEKIAGKHEDASKKKEKKKKKKVDSNNGGKTASTTIAAVYPQNNNNNTFSQQQENERELAMRLSTSSLALSKLSEQALVAAAAKAAGVDIATYQKSRQQYIHMLSRLAMGLAADPFVLQQSKLPSPPTSSIMSVSESGSSSGSGSSSRKDDNNNNIQFGKPTTGTLKHLPAIHGLHVHSSSRNAHQQQPPLSPNHAYGLKYADDDGGETAREKMVHQKLVTMTDVAAAGKKIENANNNDDMMTIKAKRAGVEGANTTMKKTEVSLADLLEKSLLGGNGGGGVEKGSGGGLKVTDSLTFAELEARGITLKDLLRVKVSMPLM